MYLYQKISQDTTAVDVMSVMCPLSAVCKYFFFFAFSFSFRVDSASKTKKGDFFFFFSHLSEFLPTGCETVLKTVKNIYLLAGAG